jgi:hypothetical protein
MSLHQNPLCALDQRPPRERAFEVLERGEAAQHDVDRALQLLRVAVGDVGKNAAFGRLVDEIAVVGLENRITGQAAARTI